jgi:hypothetical protein
MLYGLSAATAQPVGEMPLEDAIPRFVEASRRVCTYRTVELLLSPGGRVGTFFLADVARPDRFLVRQIVGSDFDEWITVGDTTWDTLALQLAGPDVGTAQLTLGRSSVNKRLLIDRFVDALRDKRPNKARSCRFDGSQFTHLEYDPLDAEMKQRLFGEADERDRTWMHLWLRDDGLLAKVQVFMRIGRWLPPVESSQMFAMYDYPIRIDDPRIKP